MMQYFTAPDHISACDLGPATVLVNYRTGDVHTLYGLSAQWWTELAVTGDAAVSVVLDTASVQMLLGQLQAAGLLVAVARPRPWPVPVAGRPIVPSWGTHEIQAGRISVARVPYRILPVALVALAAVLVVAHTGRASMRMARLMRLIGWAARRTLGLASPDQALHAVHAVRRVGLLAPGRVACLEESAAVVLTLAAFRQRVTWCHGVAADPIRLHAWVETDGGPVAEPESTHRYARLRVIPERRPGDDCH
ncbi:MAG: lasso peptide biosynthesis B2 protein [Pseudonocardiales bacterium]